MTYAEFEGLVPKLPYLWLPPWHWHEGFATPHNENFRLWTASISASTSYNIDLLVSDYRGHEAIGFKLSVYSGPKYIGFLNCHIVEVGTCHELGWQVSSLISEQPSFENDDPQSAKIWNEFVTHWMPYFRRSCWLSGCTIECTAHERLEWEMWLEQREQDWAMWTEEQQAKSQAASRRFPNFGGWLAKIWR